MSLIIISRIAQNYFSLVTLAFFGSVGMTLLVVGCAVYDKYVGSVLTIIPDKECNFQVQANFVLESFQLE